MLSAAENLSPHSDRKVVIALPGHETQTFTLPNGLTILVQEDHSAPVASVQAWVETGSIHEGQHLGGGISHLLEHLLFKGTETRSGNEFAQKVQDAGGYINAYTSFERTVYWIDIPAKGVDTALELLSDAIFHSVLPPEEYAKEQEVIRREFAMGHDDPDRVSGIALFASAYHTHPYRHPVIGHLEVFNALTRDQVMAFYKQRYVPNNVFFVVVGDVDANHVREQLEEHCGAVKRQALPPVYLPAEPPQQGRRDVHTEFATELSRLHMAWHTPAATHPDTPTLDVLSMILGHGRSSRLYRRLREEARLVHSIDAWCYSPAEPGLWGVDAVLDPDKREQVEEEIVRAIEEVRRDGISEAELAKAKRQSLSAQLQSYTTMRGKASELGSNWLLSRNLDFSKEFLNAIQRVTPEDIARVIDTYLVPQNLTAVSLNPQGSLQKTATRSTASPAGEIQKFELPNGLRLLVREDPRLPLVSMAAAFRGGLVAETAENNGISQLLAKVLVKGTQRRTAEQIADEIEAAGGGISSSAYNNRISAFVRVLQPDVALGLEILSDVLQHSTLPEKAIAREKEAQLAHIKAEEEEMMAVAGNLLRSRMLAGHPYGLRHLGTPESVARLTQADLAAFRDQHLVGRNGVLAIFGAVKAAEVRELVEKAFASMPTGEPACVSVPQPPVVPAPLQVEEFKDKQQAVLMVGFLGTDLYSADRAAIELINEASSDLGSRFFIRIREQMGLAYSVGTYHVPGLVRSPFVFYLGTDPLKLAAVQAELMAEIGQLAAEGLSAAELARAKEKLLGQLEIHNQSNDAFAFSCAVDELYGLGFDHYKTVRREVEAVTLEETRRVANDYFLKQPPVTAIVRPPSA
jgi:zinc protease